MRCDPIAKSVEWGKTREDGQQFTNWARLDSRVHRYYMDAGKRTIMRNQVQLGFDNTIWPALSRLLILGYPHYAEKIHPRASCLDNAQERARLVEAYRELTGREPRVLDWRDAI